MSESKVMLAGVESRQKEAAARKAEKLAQKANTKTVTQEDGEGFRRAFDAKQAAFLLDCQALTQQTTVKPGSVEAKDAYDVLWSRVNEINEQQVRAVMFLTAHDIGVCNKGIAEMKAACKDAKAALLPKKKFKFRSRKKKPSATPKVDPAALSSTSVATTAATVSTDTKIADLVKRSEAAVKRFTLQNLTDAKVSPSSADIAGKDCMISNLTNCTVSLLHVTTALRINNCNNCTFLIGPVQGSCHVEQVDACTFVIATRQLRVHFCTKSFFYLNAMSEPIIEDTTGAQFAPYNLRYALLEQQMEAAGFVKTKLNRWNEVKDFHWHKNTHSPNWSVLQEDQRTVTFQGDEVV